MTSLATPEQTIKVGSNGGSATLCRKDELARDGDRRARARCRHGLARHDPRQARNLLGAFDFPGDDIDKHIRELSGGERSRLVLAQMLYDPPNFLVLDEPTNHIDLETKEMLVKTLATFEGTMLFVSHDRAFLRGLATRVLDLSGGGEGIARKPLVLPGDYQRWVERTGHEAPGVHW